MENNNQRVIFSVPEETTPAETILDILEKNGIKDPYDDLVKNEAPRLVIVNNAAKDFFEKKIPEEKLSELFRKELKVSKENAMGIINGIKEKLIPFAKKITIPADEKQTEAPGKFGITDRIGPPIGVEKAIGEQGLARESIGSQKPEKIKTPTEEDEKIPASMKSKIKKVAETKEDLKPNTRQNRGPDNYREPIE